MRRSEALQGVRMIRFQSVLGRYEADELNQIEAAEMLGVSERTFRRWCRRFEDEGEPGLLDRRLGHPSAKRVPADDAAEVERLYRTRYRGFTAQHFHELLVRLCCMDIVSIYQRCTKQVRVAGRQKAECF